MQGCGQFFPPGLFDNGRAGRGALAADWELLSGKFALMARMLAALRTGTSDRIVIVSNYTQTLDLFSTLCRERQVRAMRLCASAPYIHTSDISLIAKRTVPRSTWVFEHCLGKGQQCCCIPWRNTTTQHNILQHFICMHSCKALACSPAFVM